RIVSPEGKVVYESQPRFACPECLQPPTTNAEGTAGKGGRKTASEAPIRAPSNDEMRWGGLTYLQEQWLAPSVISPQNDFLMTDMMSDVIRRGTATRALQLKRTDLAGKTGTTNDRRDTWFCGFNAGLVATAWVGFDQERSLGPGEEGGRTALPMWVYFMAEALKGVPEQRRQAPAGLCGGCSRGEFPPTPAGRRGRANQTPSSRLSWPGTCPRSRSSTARSAK